MDSVKYKLSTSSYVPRAAAIYSRLYDEDAQSMYTQSCDPCVKTANACLGTTNMHSLFHEKVVPSRCCEVLTS